jgi:hypothetical protein
MMFRVIAALFADHVQKGPNPAVMKNDDQGNQNGVESTHEDKMYGIVDPLKSKWKHNDTFLWI